MKRKAAGTSWPGLPRLRATLRKQGLRFQGVMTRTVLACLLSMWVDGIARAEAAPDAPESICDLPSARDGVIHRVRALHITHMHGRLLRDRRCPESSLGIVAGTQISKVMSDVDPAGERFGIPPGAGTWADIELEGELNDRRQFVVRRVVGYRVHHVIDSTWLEGSNDMGPGRRERLIDASLARAVPPRLANDFEPPIYVSGNLDAADANTLLDLSQGRPATPDDVCVLTVALDPCVQVSCMDDRGCWTDVATRLFRREGKSWRMVKRTEGFVR